MKKKSAPTVRVTDLKRRVSKRKFDQIEELLDSRFTVDQIAKRCGKNRDTVISVIRAIQREPLRVALRKGEGADAGTKCPYDQSKNKIGLRCAWLAGHYDKHGLEAWEKARR